MGALYAHTPNDDGDWHELDKHLLAVAEKSAEFAAMFGQEGLARLIGLWHDLGKINPVLQAYLWDCYRAQLENCRSPCSPAPHSVWGAAYAYRLMRLQGIHRWAEIVLPILGHHSRLVEPSTGAAQRIDEFLEQNPRALALVADFERTLRAELTPAALSFEFQQMSARRQELLIRMLFSVLIDADRLDTEKHFHSIKSNLRNRPKPTITELNTALTRHIAGMSTESAVLRQVRQEVYDACITSAESETGIFRLTVPTGGGKTLSSLAFALAHALHGQNDLQRVVVALPYTSIIEQNAKVYREIPGFGDEAVLEHHSAVEISEPVNEPQAEAALRALCSVENWDSRIVVTTTVQLFESLFSNRPSRVRKLHRLARSVIILDEVQAIPPEFLLPTIDVLRQLATPVSQGGYGATVVLCTATQPSFDVGPLAELLNSEDVHEIVPNYREHFARLRRVNYQWDSSPQTWNSIADRVNSHEQTMVVVNTRKDAIALLDAFGEAPPWRYHLSSLLCQAHRRKLLAEIQNLLDTNQPVQLIATQVVECGVDLDFPVVYRAIGPLDRIVQVAGRCNRHFKRKAGQVVVFNPAEGSSPRGPYKVGIGLSELLMHDRDAAELHDPALYREYFQRLYREVSLDKKNIQGLREELDFPKVASGYRLIEPTVPVIVKYGNAWKQCLSNWRKDRNRKSWRALQPFVVNLYAWEIETYKLFCERLDDDLYLWHGDYDVETHRGIKSPLSDPSDLIV